MILFDWKIHIDNAIACYMASICNDEYTEENITQCYIDLCGYIDDKTNELIGGNDKNVEDET